MILYGFHWISFALHGSINRARSLSFNSMYPWYGSKVVSVLLGFSKWNFTNIESSIMSLGGNCFAWNNLSMSFDPQRKYLVSNFIYHFERGGASQRGFVNLAIFSLKTFWYLIKTLNEGCLLQKKSILKWYFLNEFVETLG